MMESKRPELLLAIHPFTRGFAFAFFEGPLSPIDWGIKEVRGKDRNAALLAAAERLISRRQPEALILIESGLIRSRRIERLHRLIANFATGQAVDVVRYNRAQLRETFKGVGAVTRYEIAKAIAAQIHAFGHQLPPKRRIWEPEDPRMYLFDAAALVMTHYAAPARTENPEA